MRAKKINQRKVKNEIPLEKIIKGFANETRLEIMFLLEKRPLLSVENISETLEIEYKNASAHLYKLSIGGIIGKQYQGKSVLHSLTDRGKAILKFVRMIE